MADGKENRRRPHFLVVSYPAQGHINPMLQFSKRLHHKGAAVTFTVSKYLYKTKPAAALPPFPIEIISDGYDEGGFPSAESIEEYHDRYEQVGSENLRELIRRLSFSDNPVDGVVYDGFLPWALDVAKEFGLMGAFYFTQSCCVDSIYFHVYRGDIKVPSPAPAPEKEIILPGLPPLLASDLPTFLSDSKYPGFFDVLVNQFRNIEKADFVLCNTFYELEVEVVEWMKKICAIKTIGPNVPSMYMDKRIEKDKEYGFSLFKPDSEACLNWLDTRTKASVVYVAFGSYAALNLDQIEELAWALTQTNSYFLWVVRESEAGKLPVKFIEETTEKGLVVSWCSQLDVLSHDAIGCFITHCGWNSTLEALSLGVPMVAIPQWSDQSTNAKCVMDIWKTGIKASTDDTKIVRRETVVDCIKEIMEGERGKEIKRNAAKWRVLAKRAVDDGGSSDKNIDDILAKFSLGLK